MTDERLSQLLKLKAAEKPSQDFWNRFEASLERKCVQELCARPAPVQTLREKFYHWKQGLAVLSLAALGLALVVFNFSSNSPLIQGSFSPSSRGDRPAHCLSREYVRDPMPPLRSLRRDILSPNRRSSRFVCDCLPGHSPSLGLRPTSSVTCF
jgi:hypothetical protein